MSHFTIDEKLIEAARAGFVDAWRLMAGVLPQGAVDEIDGLALAVTGLDIPFCNPGMAVRAPVDPRAALQHARRFYTLHNVPWVLYAAGDAARAIAPAARDIGLSPAEPEPAMFLNPGSIRDAAAPQGLEIRTVQDDDTLDVYRSTAAEGFGATTESLAIWINPRLLGTPGLRFFLGLLDGKPVATSCVYVLHGVATINMVSTIPPYRRRGLGEAMVWKAIHEGIALGCEAVYLHSTEMGFSTYQRMGFQHAFSYQIWTS
jgi:GNAT superfamily N-acetyltransferase